MPVTEEQFEDVAKYSEVLETGSDFLEEDVRKACEEIIPFPERVEPTECMEAFVFLKNNFGYHILKSMCHKIVINFIILFL